jgi:hypothetical protein
MSNPKTLFFDSQYSYESLALPFAVLTLFVILRRCPGADDNWAGLTLVAAIGLGATTISHHLTAYALVAFLGLWAVLLLALRWRGRGYRQPDPTGMAVLGVILSLGWLVYIAHLVIGYLAPHLVDSVGELLRLMRGELASKTLFRDPAGQETPLWERSAALASTALIVLGLPVGLLRIWRGFRDQAIALALAITALLFPASLAFRLTAAGGEISDRAAVSLFLAVAFVLALGVAWLVPLPGAMRGRSILALALLTIVFAGEIVVGAGPIWSRVPGPYLVSADSRSVEPEGIDAAEWAYAWLGPDNHFAADRTNRLLLGSYGRQHAVTHLNDGVDVSPLYFATGFGPVQQQIIQIGQIRYVLVDRRLSEGLPRRGVYFEDPEPGANAHTTPIDPVALAKFDRLVNVSLVYDSGSIQIYQLGDGVREP